MTKTKQTITSTPLAGRRAMRAAAATEQEALLLDNPSYQDLVLDLEEDVNHSTKLTAIVNRVNQIKAITTNDGTKYSINCFGLPQYIFGPVMAQVLGLVNVTGAMFTDERKAEFNAITGVPTIVWEAVADAMGRPAYFSKGIVVDAIGPNADKFAMAIKLLLTNLGLPLRYADKASTSNLEKYFLRCEDRAVTAQAELTKTKLLDDSQQFTMDN